jgi:hypothetical protein
LYDAAKLKTVANAVRTDAVRATIDHIRTVIDLTRLSLPQEYFYSCLPLCVIDAVFSIGVNYSAVRATVKRWCDAQSPAWPLLRGSNTYEYTISEFLRLLRLHSPDYRAEHIFGNRQRTSARSGVLKAEAVERFSDALSKSGIERLGDTEDPEVNRKAEVMIRTIPGHKSGISFEYFLMLAGSDNFVKADRMICRFIAEATGMPQTPGSARATLLAVAKELGVAPRALDYAVWAYQRQS